MQGWVFRLVSAFHLESTSPLMSLSLCLQVFHWEAV